ncbi:DEAD/DEAH box helicase family protein [Myceligenerans halotolerans]
MTSDPNEAETRARFVEPALRRAGWSEDDWVAEYELQNPESEHAVRAAKGELRYADYVLEIDGVPIAVVEAKRLRRGPGDGLQQAIDYAKRLDVPFALSTNGQGIVLCDLIAGTEQDLAEFPSRDALWASFREKRGLDEATIRTLQVPFDRRLRTSGGRQVRTPRYYQRAAINRVISAIGAGNRRALLLMATGTGKTFTALQLIHKLRQAPPAGVNGSLRVLYLADRDILITDPMADFRTVFGEAVTRITKRNPTLSRDIYFATYHALDGDAADPDAEVNEDAGTPPSVFESYPPDFFDLVVVDECHRGSAAKESRWRSILDHFSPAIQVGLTATPKRDTNVDTYDYFGKPVYEYSLADGIADGYLAPYRVRRVMLDVDAFGWAASPGQVDVHGQPIPDGTFTTPDFERRLSLPDRTDAMARHLVRILREKDDSRPAEIGPSRAVVFCVSGDHAYAMARALRNADPDRTRRDPAWAATIVGTEPEKERLLAELTSPESPVPSAATTMRLLSTGVDIEDLDFVVLCRPVGSMVEFKQIVGRGTRLYPPKGKQYFEVVDFVGASAKFDDPEFDGPLPGPRKERVTEEGEVHVEDPGEDPLSFEDDGQSGATPDEPDFLPHGNGEDGRPAVPRRMLVVDGEHVELLGEQIRIIDPSTGRHRTVELVSYAGEQVRSLFPTLDDFASAWADPARRRELTHRLGERGIEFEDLARVSKTPDADAFDLLIHAAWNLPPRSRRERVERIRVAHGEEIDAMSETARGILDVLLDRYAESGPDEFSIGALHVPPLSHRGTPMELVQAFGGRRDLDAFLREVQAWLYDSSPST